MTHPSLIDPAALADINLSHEEIRRYSRHLIMPEVGMSGQKKLKAASVLLIGAGGLGSPLAMYLAAAGVGRIGLIDYDTVDFSNLHRQIIHGTKDVGRLKLESAKDRILDINPNVQVDTYEVPLTSANALELFAPYDIIIDGTDNFPTRYLTNDACVLLGKPNVYGSIFRFEGQASVFYAEEGPCYRCLFPEPPPPGLVPSCAEGGVLGVLPGTIGAIQTTEAIKLILGVGEPLIGRLLLYDATTMTFDEVRLRKNPNCPICGEHPTITELIDYEQFCGMPAHDRSGFSTPVTNVNGIQTIDVRQLKARRDKEADLVVLDVRDPHEFAIASLENTLRITKGDIQSAKDAVLAGRAVWEDTVLAQIPRDREVVVLCRSGKRSADSINFLAEIGYDRDKLINVEGGILAWAKDIDPSLPSY